MARSKVFQSSDKRAEVHWRFGYVRDQLSLVVDGRIAEEIEVYGTEGSSQGQNIYTTGVDYQLAGLGYRATVRVRCRHIFSRSEVTHCTIARDPVVEDEDIEDEDIEDETFHEADDAKCEWTAVSALEELGLRKEQNSWHLIREAHAALVRRYHPDVYASLSLPDELVRAAAQRLQRINEAFGFLRTLHNA